VSFFLFCQDDDPKDKKKPKDEPKKDGDPKDKKKAKEEPKKDERPKKKKAKVAVSIEDAMTAFSDARDGFDRFITYLTKKMADTDPATVAADLVRFADDWKTIDDHMQAIEDGKEEDGVMPVWPFDKKYQHDLMWWYFMASEHGFKEFKKMFKSAKPSA
jgi:hypothetical protein